MCLGVPGEVVRIIHSDGPDGLLEGEVDFGGLRRRVCLACVPEVQVGDYVIVHAGVAITRIDEQAAREMLEELRHLAALEEELGDVEPGSEPERGGTAAGTE